MRTIEQIESFISNKADAKVCNFRASELKKAVDDLIWLAKYYRAGERQNGHVIKLLRGK